MSVSLNQQIAWCELLLAQWGQDNLPWRQHALAQTLSWHLQLAYCALLNDMARAGQLHLVQAPDSISLLIQQLPAGRQCPAEWRELEQLEAGSGWLAKLRAQEFIPAKRATVTGQQQGLIATNQVQSFTVADCAAVLESLKQFIERWHALRHEC